MEIDMTKFIDEYLQKEGITAEMRDKINYKLMEGTSLDQLTDSEIKAIKTMCGADMLNTSQMRALVLMMCNDALRYDPIKDVYEEEDNV